MKTKISEAINGVHYTIDLYDCDENEINSLEFLKKVFLEAAEVAEMKVLQDCYHVFEPQGITGVLLLSTSHMSFHSWPEEGYIACDLFTCGAASDAKKALKHLTSKITHSRNETHLINRGRLGIKLDRQKCIEYFEAPVYSTGRVDLIKIDELLADEHSGIQNIQVFQTSTYGKMLAIEGAVQATEVDHHIYDRALLSKLEKSHKKMLILGGGDGFVAESALASNPELEITICEFDPMVIDFAKKYFGQVIFDNKQVKLVIGDALKFMKSAVGNSNMLFDYIVSDLTDEPIGSGNHSDSLLSFYDEVFGLASLIIKKDGVMAVMSGVPNPLPAHVNVPEIIFPLLKKHFGNVNQNDVLVPSYGEALAIMHSSKL